MRHRIKFIHKRKELDKGKAENKIIQIMRDLRSWKNKLHWHSKWNIRGNIKLIIKKDILFMLKNSWRRGRAPCLVGRIFFIDEEKFADVRVDVYPSRDEILSMSYEIEDK